MCKISVLRKQKKMLFLSFPITVMCYPCKKNRTAAIKINNQIFLFWQVGSASGINLFIQHHRNPSGSSLHYCQKQDGILLYYIILFNQQGPPGACVLVYMHLCNLYICQHLFPTGDSKALFEYISLLQEAWPSLLFSVHITDTTISPAICIGH